MPKLRKDDGSERWNWEDGDGSERPNWEDGGSECLNWEEMMAPNAQTKKMVMALNAET